MRTWRQQRSAEEAMQQHSLHGWVPGVSPIADIFAFLSALSDHQVELAESQILLWRLLRLFMYLNVVLSLVNIYWMGRVFKWW
jgi:hypothetical protein